MATYGFKFAYYQNGEFNARDLEPMVVVDTLVIAAGEMVEVTSQELDNGASGSATLLGVSAHAVDNTDDGETLKVVDGYNAVFSVFDDTERFPGDVLDINATFNGVTTDSNHDLVVMDYSTDEQDTLVMIIITNHIFNVG